MVILAVAWFLGGGSLEVAVGAKPPARLPGVYAGVLPCADCPGIRHRLQLFGDGVFFFDLAYLDRPDGPFDDLGRWHREGDVLVLEGGRDAPERWRVTTSGRLRVLDTAGREIESALPRVLQRRPGVTVEPWLFLRGQYRYFADAGRFRECRTGRVWPVAQVADNAALERAYLGAGVEPGAPVAVRVEGRVVMRPGMDGTGPRETLVVERFIRREPGSGCPAGPGARDSATRSSGRPGEPVQAGPGR